MSIEALLTDLTKAVNELNATLRTQGGAKAATNATTAPDKKPEAAEKPTPKKPAAKKGKATQEDVVNALLTLGKAQGRDAIVAILSEHGAKAAGDIKPAQYDQVVADVEAALNAE